MFEQSLTCAPRRRRRATLTPTTVARTAVGLAALVGASSAGLGQLPAAAQYLPADSSVIAPDERDSFYFYHGRPYGTDVVAGPFDVLLNKGFAVAQFNNRDRYIFDYPYAGRHVWSSVTDLPEHVERYGGWRRFLGDEVLPLSFSWREWKWAPNYFGHFIEGGMTYRRLAEWGRVHGMPAPGLTAGIITMGAAVINEMYAHPGFTHGTAATGADLLFFDPLGIVIFSIDGVADFFAHSLSANIWSSQAALMTDGELVNSGNNFVVKIPFGSERASIFLRGGLAFTPGVTWHRDDGLDVSFGIGGEGRTQNIDPDTGEETPAIAVGGGVFFDRGGTLLASLMVSEAEHRRVVLNVYPGVLPIADGRLGGWLIIRDSGHLRFGVSIAHGWGLGFGTGVGR